MSSRLAFHRQTDECVFNNSASNRQLRPLPSLFLNQVHAALGAFARFVHYDIGVHCTSVLNRLGAVLVLALTGFLFFAAADGNRDGCEGHDH